MSHAAATAATAATAAAAVAVAAAASAATAATAAATAAAASAASAASAVGGWSQLHGLAGWQDNISVDAIRRHLVPPRTSPIACPRTATTLSSIHRARKTGMLVQAVIASVGLVDAASLCTDISGEWTSGWPIAHDGGAPPPLSPAAALLSLRRSMTVRKAVTPFGKPHAQYVVDYNAALALHPNLQTCLGNGTCSPPQFGLARALNK